MGFGLGKNKTKISIERTSPDRYADLAAISRNKQRVIYSLLIVIILLIIILGTISFKNNTKVYIVEKDHNNYTYLGYVNDLTREVYNPDDNSIEYFLNDFIKKARFLSTDLVLYKKNQQSLGYFLENMKVAKKLDKSLEEAEYPMMIKSNFAVDIELVSTLRVSPESFQIRWWEIVYDENGKLLSKDLMVGILKYEIKKPKNKETILVNPLGIIITDLSISKEN